MGALKTVGGILAIGVEDRVAILGRRLVEILGLRRPALHQIGGQDDIGPHLQKFALPVLEQGGQKGAAWSSG